MPRPIEQMESKRPSDQELEPGLGGEGESGGGGGERRGLDVPAGQGGRQVGYGEEVEGAGEAAAGDSGPDGGGEPGLLVVVGGEVGGDGAVEALGGEEGLRFRGG